MTIGKNNSSSVPGGIFGEPMNNAPPPPRSARPSPFEQMSAAAPTAPANKQNINTSSLPGGIFGGAESAPSERRENVTKSSVEGGIFGGNNPYAYAEPTANPTKASVSSIDTNMAAGQAMPEQENFSLFAGGAAAPLAPAPSSRFNPNRPSVEGGIFGAPPAMHKPQIQRANPNSSSIEGGIFG